MTLNTMYPQGPDYDPCAGTINPRFLTLRTGPINMPLIDTDNNAFPLPPNYAGDAYQPPADLPPIDYAAEAARPCPDVGWTACLDQIPAPQVGGYQTVQNTRSQQHYGGRGTEESLPMTHAGQSAWEGSPASASQTTSSMSPGKSYTSPGSSAGSGVFCRSTETKDGQVCGKWFKDPGELNKHTKYHKRPKKCPRCPKTVGTPRDLERHIDSHHRESADRTRVHCPRCGTAFTRKDNRKRHLRNTHGQAKTG